jgi:hypothetical protein
MPLRLMIVEDDEPLVELLRYNCEVFLAHSFDQGMQRDSGRAQQAAQVAAGYGGQCRL